MEEVAGKFKFRARRRSSLAFLIILDAKIKVLIYDL